MYKRTSMNVGLPGTGLGGIFYLVGALVMPLVELSRFLVGQGDRERLKLAVEQGTIALGMVAALVLTFWLIDTVSAHVRMARSEGEGTVAMVNLTGHTRPIVVTLIVLGALLLSIHIMEWVFSRRQGESLREEGPVIDSEGEPSV